MKIIKYKFLSCQINHGTEEEPDFEQILLDKSVICQTKASYDINYSIAEKEAVGEIIIEDDFNPDPVPTPSLDIWAELDSAYASGINSI